MQNESFLEKVSRHIRTRMQVLFENDILTLAEKANLVSHRNIGPVAKAMIKKRHVKPESGEPYFALNGFKIFYRPPFGVNDQEYFMNGICQVLAESFIYPELFSEEVRLRPGDVVLDLGANIGTTALIFSKEVGPNGKVFAVEPVTHNIIENNIRENHLNNITVIPKAVSDQEGKTEIEVSDFCLDSSIAKRQYTTEKKYYKQKISVDLEPVDKLVERLNLKKLNFIKMDIEGVEELALKGAKDVIKKFKPVWSISSYHIDFNNEPQHDKLVKILKGYGYQIKESAKSHIFAW